MDVIVAMDMLETHQDTFDYFGAVLICQMLLVFIFLHERLQSPYLCVFYTHDDVFRKDFEVLETNDVI